MAVKRYKKEDSSSYALGTTLTIELIKNRPEIVKRVFIHPNLIKDETYQKIITLCNKWQIPVEESIKAFNILVSKENCFVIGEFTKYEDLIQKNENHIVLVNPADAGNLGTIIRSAMGFGIRNIVVILPAVDVYSPKAVRSSMGALFGIHFQYFKSFAEYQKLVGERPMYPFMLKAQTYLYDVTAPKEPYSLIFGNEASGLPDEFINVGTPLIIKQTNLIDSFNLPIAVSVAMYEFTKEK